MEGHPCRSRLGSLGARWSVEWRRALTGDSLRQLFKMLPDLHEAVASGPARREMKPQMTSRTPKSSANLEQLKPYGFQPSASEIGESEGVQTEQHQQLVSERMELKPKGIGTIAMAGKPIGAKVAFKFFNPILALSAVVIAVVDLFGSTGPVSDDKADIGSQRADFDFDHNSSSLVPASGSVAKAIEESHRSFGTGIFALGLFEPALGSFLEYGVRGDSDSIEHFEGFQGPVDLGSGRAGIGPIADLTFRETTLNKGNQPAKLGGDSRRGRGIAGAKLGREQRTGFSFEEKQWVIHMLAVFSVKEGKLLLAVAGIVRGV